MDNRVKTGLAGRMNQYVEYRRKVSKDRRSFSEALSSNESKGVKKVAARTPQTTSKSAKTIKSGSRGRSGRAAKRARPRSGLKHITRLQASRLAKYAPIIQQASKKYSIPVELICGVILQESGGNFKAVSHCGARGLMQIMPPTARRLGVKNSFDPVQNIMGGTKYIRMLLDRFDGNVSLALAGYNAGEGNVEKYGRKIPPFKETQAYVPNVLKYANTLWSILRTNQPVRRVEAHPQTVSRPRTVQHRTIFRPIKRV